MDQRVWKSGVRRTGAAFVLTGVAVMSFALFVPPEASAAAPANTFQGLCVGNASAGTCTLDEPEGKNTATHGTVTYARVANVLSYVIAADHSVQDVQICMQTSGAFAAGANVCAGSHGHHVAYTHNANAYAVDLAHEGFANSDPLYWTLHVVSGGRTLQVMSPLPAPSPSTTTTGVPSTTTTTHKSTTTTTHGSTTSTTIAGTTTTTGDPSTSTTTTTDPAVTTTTIAGSELVATTTSSPTRVLGETLSRTGGIQLWVLVAGLVMLIAGACLLGGVRRSA